MDDRIIQKYKEDEDIMIRLFIQWCLNRNLDPAALYAEAYPEQPANPRLQEILSAEADEPIEVETGTLLEVLQLFGNDDLAFAVAEADERLKRRRP